jgi:hypothetical protein
MGHAMPLHKQSGFNLVGTECMANKRTSSRSLDEQLLCLRLFRGT